MKKIVLSSILAAATLTATYADAQAQSTSFYSTSYKTRNIGSFSEGTQLLSFGLGFPNQATRGYYTLGSRKMGFGPIYAKYEYGIKDEIGLGARLAYGIGSYKYGNVKANNSAIGLSLLGYYHFNKLIPVKNLDVYAGAGLGFRYRNYESIDWYGGNSHATVSHNQFTVLPVFIVGARWYFNSSFSAYLESGYDAMSQFNLGVSFRF